MYRTIEIARGIDYLNLEFEGLAVLAVEIVWGPEIAACVRFLLGILVGFADIGSAKEVDMHTFGGWELVV